MIEKIKHYSMCTPNSVYDEEAMTALELASRTASKVNELIDATDAKLTEQDAKNAQFQKDFRTQYKADYATQIEHIAETIDAEMETHINAGEYDDVIGERAAETVQTQMIPYGRFIASDGYNYEIKADELVKGEQYSNSNGQVVTGATAYRSKYIYPCREGVYFTFDGIVNGAMNPYNYIACFDHNMQFIGFSRLSATVFTGDLPLNVTLKGTCFVGFTFMVMDASTTLAGVQLHHIDKGELQSIYHPFEHNNVKYAYFANHWCDGLATTIKSAENFDCVVFNVDGLKSITSTETNLKNAIFIDANNAIISYGDTYAELPRGRVYDVPENAVICVMNFSNHTTVQGDILPNEIVGLVYKNGKGLNGKIVLVLGDSISWLDGKQGYDDTNAFKGWQDELRKRGAIVYTCAYSGEPVYAYGDYLGIPTRASEDGGIIPYDVCIMFAGSNDARLGSPLKNLMGYMTSFDPSYSFEEAYANMIAMVNSSYTLAQQSIFCCSLIPSKAMSHDFQTDEKYSEAIKLVSTIMGGVYIDLFNKMPKPDTPLFEELFYDDTHPNVNGMKQIGTIIANEIERVVM